MNPAEHIDANVPEDIRNFSIWFCETYSINGICDPMYVCNITAMYLGRGDGQSNFGDGLFDPYDSSHDRALVERGQSRYAALSRRLCGSYGANIPPSSMHHVFGKVSDLRMVAVS